ncbi:MAG: transporter associated domain-containing protein [Actinomycetota bacterium]
MASFVLATVTFGLPDVLTLVGVLLLLVLAMVLVAGEEALIRTNAVRVESLEGADPRRVSRLLRLLAEPEAVLNPLRLVILFVQLVETTLVALLSARFLPWPATALVVVANVLVVFVLTEVLPRTMGILRTDGVALRLARPVELVAGFAPVRVVANLLIALTNWAVPGKGLRHGPFSSPEDLIAFADAAVEDEVLEQGERDLIESVIEFGGTVVREVMVPRTDMTTVDRNLTVSDALEVTSLAGFSRVPVVGASVDDVIGLVYVKDLIRAELDGQADQLVESVVRTARFVPETKKVSQLLTEMQAEKYHMAVAVDEYGGIAGLVTLEDLIEELVGEIVDEYDVEESLVERQVDGSIRVDARISIGEVNDLSGMELPEGDWDTVGGLVFDRFGRVPIVGEHCEVNGYSLRVERVQGRRITRVKIVRPTMARTDSVPS